MPFCSLSMLLRGRPSSLWLPARWLRRSTMRLSTLAESLACARVIGSSCAPGFPFLRASLLQPARTGWSILQGPRTPQMPLQYRSISRTCFPESSIAQELGWLHLPCPSRSSRSLSLLRFTSSLQHGIQRHPDVPIDSWCLFLRHINHILHHNCTLLQLLPDNLLPPPPVRRNVLRLWVG